MHHRRIHVPLPDKTTRAQLVKKALAGVICDLNEDQYLILADKVAHYSGRDLVAVCRSGRVSNFPYGYQPFKYDLRSALAHYLS